MTLFANIAMPVSLRLFVVFLIGVRCGVTIMATGHLRR
jgi:hypothetical protein